MTEMEQTAKATKRPRRSYDDMDVEEAQSCASLPPPVKRMKKDYEWMALLNVLKDILSRLEDMDTD
jgi:hypothetical protein